MRPNADLEGTTSQHLSRAIPVSGEFPERLEIDWPLRQVLRYGENPHQAGALYTDPAAGPPAMGSAASFRQGAFLYNIISMARRRWK